jgi:hypothetical protein
VLRVAPFGTSRSVNRNVSIRILYSDGDDFPGHVDELVPGEVEWPTMSSNDSKIGFESQPSP